MTDPATIARGLSEAQRGLLADLCYCPGLFAGQYVYDGAGIEHLPNELWRQSYTGGAGLMGLGRAYPSETGLAVQAQLEKLP